MSKETKKKSFWERLTQRYQFNVMNQENYEVKSMVNLSLLHFIIWGVITLLIASFLIFSIISYTSIKQYIPGYGKINERKTALKHQTMADSLLVKVEQNNMKLRIMEKVLRGDFDTSMHAEDLFSNNYDSLVIYSESKEDSILRAEVELRERFTIFDEELTEGASLGDMSFFPPLKGTLSDSFKSDESHFGIDIVAGRNKEVKAVADGTIIFAEFSIESGYIVGISHKNDLVSIYKHNSQIKRKVGDLVESGEVIAVAGNTGELSSGPHLHLELWYEGDAIDPLKYISFE